MLRPSGGFLISRAIFQLAHFGHDQKNMEPPSLRIFEYKMVNLIGPKVSIRSRGTLTDISKEFIKNIPVHLELSTRQNFIFGQDPSRFLALLGSSFCALNSRRWRVGNESNEGGKQTFYDKKNYLSQKYQAFPTPSLKQKKFYLNLCVGVKEKQ